MLVERESGQNRKLACGIRENERPATAHDAVQGRPELNGCLLGRYGRPTRKAVGDNAELGLFGSGELRTTISTKGSAAEDRTQGGAGCLPHLGGARDDAV
jgi:hypothetical protein